MDIPRQAEIVLRNAHYETWTWASPNGGVTCFESAAIMGFVHVFDTAAALMNGWQSIQKIALARHAATLRSAGTKAWNVYSVFLTADSGSPPPREIERIDEDFTLTRKIARSYVTTPDDVVRALLPLIAIRSHPQLGASNFEARLRSRLKNVPSHAVSAFLNDAPTTEVARILGAKG